MSDRVLGYSVPVHIDGATVKTYPAGTSESEIPEEHLGLITNPKAWGPSPLEVEDDGARLARGIVLDDDDDGIPEKLADCTEKQLRAIAERGIDGEPIPLGRVRSKGDIIEILREAGVEDGD